jgi:hypothetical protein
MDEQKPVVLVCGFGRCGSSVIMQMLEAGGHRITGLPPAYEHAAGSMTSFDPQWIARQHGTAVKVLDPHRPHLRFSAGYYRIIWAYRNRQEQALSQAKFVNVMLGLPIDRTLVKDLAKSYRKDQPAAIRKLSRLGFVLPIAYEQTLRTPRAVASEIARFCDLPPESVSAMAGVVIPRDSKCAPGFEVEIALLNKSKEAENEQTRGDQKGDGKVAGQT